MKSLRRVMIGAAAAVLAAGGCATSHRQVRSNALDFLYPEGTGPSPPTEVRLVVPVRVGIAFPPSAAFHGESFTEDRKADLLERIAVAFRDRAEIASVQVIPATYLSPKGGFPSLDRVAAAFGVDLAALVSYDQVQFRDSTTASFLYWTIVGAYVVKGEKNETRTRLDAAVFDIKSRALLFNASGQSSVGGKATPVQTEAALRQRSDDGFKLATDELIANLRSALDEFKRQAATGSVRGPGTPALAMVDASTGEPISPEGGADGGGAVGLAEAALMALLLAGARRLDRRRGV